MRITDKKIRVDRSEDGPALSTYEKGHNQQTYEDDEYRASQSVRVISRAEYCTENFKTDIGTPFLFEGRDYFLPIYNVRRRFLAIIASRQAEKSSFAGKNILCELGSRANEALAYFTAAGQHLSEFIRRKIDRQFDYNENLQAKMLGPGVVDSIHEKVYKNKSTLAGRAIGQSVESARSVVARKVYFDETQNILSDNIPIAKEVTQSYPDDSEYVFLGTPLTTNNYLSMLYRDSKQYEWIITCGNCYKRNPPLGMGHIDENKPYLFCSYCGKKMNPGRGQWAAMSPDAKYDGFRICRLMTPTCRWFTEAQDGILDKLRDYALYQFKNEVLGMPEDTGVVPITTEEVRQCCGEYSMIDPHNPPDWVRSVNVAMTIDWAWSTKESGVSYTIIALWTLDGARLKCLYAKRFAGQRYEDPDKVLKEIVKIVGLTGCRLLGSDYGVGHKENRRLDNLIGEAKIAEFLYTGSSEQPLYNQREKRYHVGRTQSLDQTFTKIKRLEFLFPYWDEIEPYAQDILNVYTEVDPNMKRVKYEHAGTGPDDFLHLMNYAQMIGRKGGFN